MNQNILIHGNNMDGLHHLLTVKKLRGKIDLVYIDPPYATGGNFTITDDRVSTISNAKNGHLAYSDTLKGEAFIAFLRERLLLLRELLADAGSLYLHIDYKIGHYVKVMMDEVFGIENFRNDITRIKCNPKNFQRLGFGNVKDMVLFYTKSSHPIWNEPKESYTDADRQRLFTKVDSEGRHYTTVPLHAPGETVSGGSSQPFRGIAPPVGRHWRTDVKTLEEWDNAGLIEWSSQGNPRKMIFADEREGKRVQDIWEFKDPQYPTYPTEKNAEMLELIVKTSSREESIVLDCFCGSGTTLLAAQRLRRRWIGIDQSEHAIAAVHDKLGLKSRDLLMPSNSFEFISLLKAESQKPRVTREVRFA